MYPCPNFEPVCCSLSTSNCCFLTCIPISQKAGKVDWYSHLFNNFAVSWDAHRQRLLHSQTSRSFPGIRLLCLWPNGDYQFDIWVLCLFWIQLVHFEVLFSETIGTEQKQKILRRDGKDMIVWTFVGIALLWDWNESLPFPVLCPLLSGPNLLAYWVQYFNNIII